MSSIIKFESAILFQERIQIGRNNFPAGIEGIHYQQPAKERLSNTVGADK